METNTALGITFTMSLISFGLLFNIFLLPILKGKNFYKVLCFLLLIQTFRTVGLTTILPAVHDIGFPEAFGNQVAWGDFISAVLAMACILLIKVGKVKSLIPVWIFNVFGAGDLITSLYHAAVYDAASYSLGVSWFLLCFYVPLLYVVHFVIFRMLITKKI